MVPQAQKASHSATHSASKLLQCLPKCQPRRKSKTQEKSTLEDLCLESLWRDKLSRQGWSERAVMQFPLAWSKSTILTYNRVIKEFFKFCSAKLLTFPPCNSDVIVAFLCTIADDSHRPQSQLNTTKAALSHLYDCYDIPCPADGKDITLFTSALIKSQTQHTMKKSTVMPIHKFTTMFLRSGQRTQSYPLRTSD